MQRKAKSYIAFILISWAVGGLAAYLTREGNNIFDDIKTPMLTPPAIVFPIVWSILYTLLGIGAAKVYIGGYNGFEGAKIALGLFAADLAVNFFWSIIFFNMRDFGAAFIVLLVLLLISIVMTAFFGKVNKTAALLQIPYLLWISFAGYLTLMIFLMNR